MRSFGRFVFFVERLSTVASHSVAATSHTGPVSCWWYPSLYAGPVNLAGVSLRADRLVQCRDNAAGYGKPVRAIMNGWRHPASGVPDSSLVQNHHPGIDLLRRLEASWMVVPPTKPLCQPLKLHLQSKSGDSYLYTRKRDSAEISRLPKLRHADYWTDQAYPVIQVIRTSDGKIRWMEVRDWLREATDGGKKQVHQIEFDGDRLDVMSVRRWRDRALRGT